MVIPGDRAWEFLITSGYEDLTWRLEVFSTDILLYQFTSTLQDAGQWRANDIPKRRIPRYADCLSHPRWGQVALTE